MHFIRKWAAAAVAGKGREGRRGQGPGARGQGTVTVATTTTTTATVRGPPFDSAQDHRQADRLNGNGDEDTAPLRLRSLRLAALAQGKGLKPGLANEGTGTLDLRLGLVNGTTNRVSFGRKGSPRLVTGVEVSKPGRSRKTPSPASEASMLAAQGAACSPSSLPPCSKMRAARWLAAQWLHV
jgi:hypothetical protein